MKFWTCLLVLISVSANYGQQKYFQQEVNNTIEVKLDDVNHILHGYIQIEYINNSPDDLDQIFIHLWPNAYKNNTSAMAEQLDENGELAFHFADAEDRGYIDSLEFMINGNDVSYTNYNDEPDIALIKLPKTLEPNEKIFIETPFKVKIPKGIYSRLGHIGQSYQITQWFPKPAVYDRDGWHPIPYLSQGEFYSEYGSYDVSITVPINYVLAATGDLVDGENELKFWKEKEAKTLSYIENNNFPTNKAGLPDMRFPKSSDKFKTLRFRQDNVHDFAWFADKRYHVLSGEVKLPNSDRTVNTYAFFTNNEADLWKDAIEYLNDATFYYSKWVGEYPYNHVTAVDGSISAGGGMEYPNITVIGESYTPKGLEQVIVHEVGHNWFYGILGTNERANAWMDEGLNTFTETRYAETKYENSGLNLGLPEGISEKVGINEFGPRGTYDIGYVMNARRNYDQPLQLNSMLFTPTNYGLMVYGKTAIGFDYLRHYLGDKVFDNSMRAYYDAWKFKHPQPNDLREIFENTTGEDLSWLFEDFIKTNKKIDYAIKGMDKKEKEILLKNNGGIDAPVIVSLLSEDGSIVEQVRTKGFSDKKTVQYKAENFYKVEIDEAYRMPDVNRKNNHLKAKGLFKQVEPVKFRFLGSYERDEESTIYYSPAMGWNQQDNFMLGAAFYNKVFPSKKFEWYAVPLFSFGANTATGLANLKYEWQAHQVIRRAILDFDFKSFHNHETSYNITDNKWTQDPARWNRAKIGLDLELYNNLRKAKHNVELEAININEEFSKHSVINALRLEYRMKNRQPLKPMSFNFTTTALSTNMEETFVGVSAEFNWRINYNLKRKGMSIRLFAAQTLYEEVFSNRFNWSLTGQQGLNDYLYDHTFLGRSAAYPNALSQQMAPTFGDFGVATLFPVGSNSTGVAAINLKLEAPIKIPIGWYVDGGVYPIKRVMPTETINELETAATTGFYLALAKNILEVYVPVWNSESIERHLDYYDVTFMQRIKLVININQIGPFKLLNDIKP